MLMTYTLKHNIVKPLNTEHSGSPKYRPLFGGVRYSEGTFCGKYNGRFLKKVRYSEVSAIKKCPLLKEVSLYIIPTF